MKYVIGIVSVVVLAVVLAFSGLKGATPEQEYLRIHIRANSNSAEDQAVKYMVRDAIVEALIPILAEVESKDEAIITMQNNFAYIEGVAEGVLKDQGFYYGAKASINNEYFPTRTYEDLVLEDGFYDALIIALGSGTGDNWWCVVYPAFCFLNTRNSSNYVYISKIWEIINSVIK